jgi:hypothetical protein
MSCDFICSWVVPFGFALSSAEAAPAKSDAAATKARRQSRRRHIFSSCFFLLFKIRALWRLIPQAHRHPGAAPWGAVAAVKASQNFAVVEAIWPLLPDKFKGNAIHAVAQPGRRRAVFKDVA